MPQKLGQRLCLALPLCGSAITPSLLPSVSSSLAGTEAGRAAEPDLSLLPGNARARWVRMPWPSAASEGWPWWLEVNPELRRWPALCSLGQPYCLQPKPAPLPTTTPLRVRGTGVLCPGKVSLSTGSPVSCGLQKSSVAFLSRASKPPDGQ